MNDAQLFKKIISHISEAFEKNHDIYGDTFEKLYQEIGPIIGIVPLYANLKKATNTIKSNKNNVEMLQETFEDLALYAIMNLIELNRDSIKTVVKKEKTRLNENLTDIEEELLETPPRQNETKATHRPVRIGDSK